VCFQRQDNFLVGGVSINRDTQITGVDWFLRRLSLCNDNNGKLPTILTRPDSATNKPEANTRTREIHENVSLRLERLIGSAAPPFASRPVFQDALQTQNLHKRLIPDQDEGLSSNENAKIYDALPSMPVARLFHVCPIPEPQ
jgi:hypothetical protein